MHFVVGNSVAHPQHQYHTHAYREPQSHPNPMASKLGPSMKLSWPPKLYFRAWDLDCHTPASAQSSQHPTRNPKFCNKATTLGPRPWPREPSTPGPSGPGGTFCRLAAALGPRLAFPVSVCVPADRAAARGAASPCAHSGQQIWAPQATLPHHQNSPKLHKQKI